MGGLAAALLRSRRRRETLVGDAARLWAWPWRADCIMWGSSGAAFAAAGRGRLAQLVEHLVYTERVGGSSPSPPTIP